MFIMFFKILAAVVILVLLILVFFLAYSTLTDYKPPELVPLPIKSYQNEIVRVEAPYKITTFNIGYCGLDKNQDFFMDGGETSRSASRDQTLSNLTAAANFLSGEDPSFILLQEVDIDSSRSFHTNQPELFLKTLPGYNSVFGTNYKVRWVPVPLTKPMGSVHSGLLVLSRFNIASSTRYQYPGGEKWPRQLFELDRCFVESRLPVEESSRELVLINSHLSAYDEGGVIRKKQLDYLREHILSEYQKGNYVIVGGDWNHVLPGTDPGIYTTTEEWPQWLQTMPENFTPEGFIWGADRNIPSNRTVSSPYRKGGNFTSVIDGFLVSPNVELKKVNGHQLDFENSDHNPLSCTFILKK